MEDQVTPKRKKWYRRKWIYAMAIGVFIFGSIAYSQYRKSSAGPSYETAKVARGTVSQTVDATGNVESANELDLRFEAGGRIGKMYKQTNDQVKVGDVIVELELGELNARVAQASAGVQRTQANLQKVLNGETTDYISNLKAKLDQAQANLDQIRATSADTVANAEAALATSENNLKLSQGGENSEIVQDAYDDMVAILQSSLNAIDDGMTEADNILGIDNVSANDEFDDTLSSLNTNALRAAENKYRTTKMSKQKADTYNSITTYSSNTQVEEAIGYVETALVDVKDLLFSVSDVLNNTAAVGDLSQSELTALKTNIQTVRSTITTQYTSLLNQKQAIAAAKNSYSTNQVAYNQAKINLDNARQKASADIAVYEALLAQAQASYDDAVGPARSEDVAVARAQLYEAQASLAQAVAVRNKSRIVAPIDGVVGKIVGKVGEYVSAQDAVVKLVNPHFEVKVDIPETDIIKISVGNDAQVTLDAYGDDVKFVGKVTEIETGETVIQDVVYYQVTVALEDKDAEHKILNGMTANLLFYTEEKQDALYIPQRVVRNDNGKKIVRVLGENNEVSEVSVETGLRGDNGFVEVLSGLSEGQEVVVKEIESR